MQLHISHVGQSKKRVFFYTNVRMLAVAHIFYLQDYMIHLYKNALV